MRRIVAVSPSIAVSLAAVSLASLVIAGCDCGGAPLGSSCDDSTDCRAGQVCIDGVCRARSDGDTHPPDGTTECRDFDRDGRGEGCPAGPDCDDSNAAIGGNEVCDTLDNDCDGTTDEGLAGVCTACTPACEVESHPGPEGWMPTDENSEGVIVDMGDLTLGRMMAASFSVWVANSDEGTVSKLDSRTNRELARYPTVGAMAPAGSRPWNERCGWCDPSLGGCIGNCASRTAVDQAFDAYVANRAFGNQGTVTKYANREEDCVDRNMNGVIDTSRDLNGDGTIALTPEGIGNEYVGLEDECILWTVPVGSNGGGVPGAGGTPRALAIGLAPPDGLVGEVWVGLYVDQQACRLDPATGATLACVPINSIRPYGAASDSMGRIWFVDRTASRRDILGYVEPSTMTFVPASPVPEAISCATGNLAPYGVTVDGEGHVFIASSGCDPGILRYTPGTDTWDSFAIVDGGTPRGVAADETSLWVGISHSVNAFGGSLDNRVAQFRLSDMSFVANHRIVDPATGNPCTGTVGVGVSFDGSVWAICQGTNQAARLDPATGTWIVHGVGLTPYTYSDFIGYGLNVFAEPRGRYRFRLEGCPGGEFGGQTWLGARVDADIPPSTYVEIWARTAELETDLAMRDFVGPFAVPVADFTMAPGPLPPGRYIEIEIRMRTEDRRTAPRIHSIDVAGECSTTP